MGDHELNSISPDQILPDYSSKDSSSDHVKRRHSRLCLLAAVVFVLGVCCLVTGVLLIVLSQTQKSATESRATNNTVNEEGPCNTTFSGSKNNTKTENPCALSLEAKLAGRTIKWIWDTDVSVFPLSIITRNFSLSVKRNPVQMLRKAIRFNFFSSNVLIFISASILKKKKEKPVCFFDRLEITDRDLVIEQCLENLSWCIDSETSGKKAV